MVLAIVIIGIISIYAAFFKKQVNVDEYETFKNQTPSILDGEDDVEASIVWKGKVIYQKLKNEK